ncbi:MAG TPA: hypothetical protein VED84_07800 [Acidimicrobiales bacterium]|nr:hypothetical protein [Acidimicrobiales bacterium]
MTVRWNGGLTIGESGSGSPGREGAFRGAATVEAGGAVADAAVVLARLGLRVAPASFLTDD